MSSRSMLPTDDSDMMAPGNRGIPGVSDAAPELDGDEDSQASAQEAGYVELPGAKKDAQCDIVNVPGGVSSEKGCCNLYKQQPNAQGFSCGQCTHVGTSDEEKTKQELPDQGENAQQPMSSGPATGQGGSNFS